MSKGCLALVALGLYDVADLVVWVMSGEDMKVDPQKGFHIIQQLRIQIEKPQLTVPMGEGWILAPPSGCLTCR